MSDEVSFWSTDEAALSLARNLRRLEELEASKSQYKYSYPPQLMDDMRDAARNVKAAVRYLMSSDADDS